MDLGLQGKVVLVTAASKGLGFATAKRFAAEGAAVVLASRNETAVSGAARIIREETGNERVIHCVADVTSASDIERIFSTAEQAFGGVDVLVNNTGGPPPGTFDTITEEQWQYAHSLILLSAIRCIRRALPHMRRQKWGRIVNFASSSIKQPIEGLLLSNTYRAALTGLAKTLSVELAPDNILINTMGPGRIATDRVAELDAARAEREGISAGEVRRQFQAQIPLGRYGDPDEFAALACFLGSAANGYITGQAILVDGGMVKSL